MHLARIVIVRYLGVTLCSASEEAWGSVTRNFDYRNFRSGANQGYVRLVERGYNVSEINITPIVRERVPVWAGFI